VSKHRSVVHRERTVVQEIVQGGGAITKNPHRRIDGRNFCLQLVFVSIKMKSAGLYCISLFAA
jgi:hypothetical protein